MIVREQKENKMSEDITISVDYEMIKALMNAQAKEEKRGGEIDFRSLFVFVKNLFASGYEVSIRFFDLRENRIDALLSFFNIESFDVGLIKFNIDIEILTEFVKATLFPDIHSLNPNSLSGKRIIFYNKLKTHQLTHSWNGR